ncbi:MAG TPA: helix-turn-helix domain-containing protein [Polyangiaceae bacterium]
MRFVAATNRDLEEEVAAGRFRRDLWFRLNAVVLEVPPLRDRVDEIEALARRFLEQGARQLGRPCPELGTESLALLRGYDWPGNVRELRNVIERALLLCDGPEVRAPHLPTDRLRARLFAPAAKTEETPASKTSPSGPAASGDPAVVASLRELERRAVIDALARCAGNQTRAAELLGIGRRTLCTKLKEYGIARPRAPADPRDLDEP